MTDNLKNLKTFFNRIDAEIARGFLESNGISSYIFSDDAGSMYPSQDFVNGVKLYVGRQDFKKAKEMLDLLEFETEDGED
ncbi:MAG: DUF2007 domain-containing protein [Actinobacteria bacterium]|nr:DUF2007 domain-containing protein [Actinomycetota bacterium]